MKHKKYWILIAVLSLLAILIHLFSSSSVWVEHYYSTGIYPYISFFLRFLLGWLPFSVGDILYGLISLWLLIKIVKTVQSIFKKRLFSRGPVIVFQRLGVVLLLIYILFNTLWGINYSRKGIASQLGLSIEKYSIDELKTLNSVLLQKVNAINSSLMQNPAGLPGDKELFSRSLAAFEAANKQYAFLNYHPASLKTSLWGWLGNYLGFLGYYNPFTGEGQVNTTAPKFLLPYTSCHEIAHQLGYAKENEANFVGYLAAVSSKDEFYHYSVYLNLFLYANSNLFHTDSIAANAFAKKLLPAVKQDLKEWRQFSISHKNPVEPVIRWLYGKFLESNQQPSGVLSYDEVTGFMIAYYKAYGKL
ncbi:MAG: DUF3810 domain-containing protein [Ferruginibacter sp.]|nr:DUF3810 domain-containing protein [Ferruginibacter sp.]